MNNNFDQIEYNTYFQIDTKLGELRRKLNSLREQRKNSEYQCNTLENKVKILSMDDKKFVKKIENEIKTKDLKETIQSKILQEKQRIFDLKKSMEEYLKLKISKNEEIRENIRNITTNWKNKLYESNKNQWKKFKFAKEENEKFINMIKYEEEQKNKQQYTIIKTQFIQSVEKIKQYKIHKKLRIKEELEAKINEEMNLKGAFDEKINQLEDQEKNLFDKKKKTLNEFTKISKFLIVIKMV